MPRTRLAAVAAVALAAAPGPAADALEEGLLAKAGEVVRVCKARGYKSVGVLKFRVTKTPGLGGLSDNVGTLNLSLARRLEVALVLGHDRGDRDPVRVIRDASGVAAGVPGADHQTAAGQAALFGARYPALWGAGTVSPDAFVTGYARVGDDLRTVEVQLVLFGRRDGLPLKPVGGRFTAAVDPGLLGEVGESFTVRGAGDPVAAAARVKAGAEPHPLQAKSSPVGLLFRYDGQPVPLEFRAGKGFVPTPKPGQRVELVLSRADPSPDTYGAVLKVNGENTLDRQVLPDVDCRKWVLPPGCDPVVVAGYQVDDRTAAGFKVLSRRESAARAVDYGADVGTVTLTVFKALAGRPAAPPADDRAAQVAAVKAQAVPRKETFDDLYDEYVKEFGAKAAGGAEDGGLVVPGGKVGSRVKRVPFAPDPTPVAAVTVTYFTP